MIGMAGNRDGQEGASSAAASAPQAEPLLCASNCGFYGNPATLGMCSVCYKKQSTGPATASPPVTTASASRSVNEVSKLKAALVSPSPTNAVDVPASSAAAGRDDDKLVDAVVSSTLRPDDDSSAGLKLLTAVLEKAPAAASNAPVVGKRIPRPAGGPKPAPGEGEVRPVEVAKVAVEGPQKCTATGASLINAPKKAQRCFACQKRVTLALYGQCKCGKVFCLSHRLAEQHSCTFDYKGAGAAILSKANPLVQTDKMGTRI